MTLMRSCRGYQYDLIEALRKAKLTILAGDCITDIAADEIEKLQDALRCMVEAYEHEASINNPALVNARAVLDMSPSRGDTGVKK